MDLPSGETSRESHVPSSVVKRSGFVTVSGSSRSARLPESSAVRCAEPVVAEASVRAAMRAHDEW